MIPVGDFDIIDHADKVVILNFPDACAYCTIPNFKVIILL